VKSGDRYYDIKSMKLLENQVIGSRETHRIVIETQDTEFAPMGKIINTKGEVM
jgi:hypothetical protein